MRELRIAFDAVYEILTTVTIAYKDKDPVMLSPYDGRSGRIDKRWNVIENRIVEADV